MRRVAAIAAVLAGLAFGVGATEAADRAIIVLDASGSMLAKIGGKRKIDIARDTLREVLSATPDELELGLEVYGRRSKGDCDDIETLVEPRPAFEAVDQIIAATRDLKPLGKTPIAAAVKHAAETLKYQEDTATVILITDGEDTCSSDPCAVARELEAAGVAFTTHVVGFGLSDAEGKKVACLAEETGGQYIQAGDAPQLAQAVQAAVTKAAEPPPLPAPTYVIGPGMEDNTDRFGSDYTSIDQSEPDPAACQKACDDADECYSWSLVRPGFQGPQARCYLKSVVAEARPNECCISGVDETPATIPVDLVATDGTGAAAKGATSWTLTAARGSENLLAGASTAQARAKLLPGDYAVSYEGTAGKGSLTFTVVAGNPLSVQVAQTEAAAPAAAPSGPAFFEDGFEGSDLKPDWTVENPDTDKYVVEDSELLLVASGGNLSMASEAPSNLFLLNRELPDGDWDLTATVQLSVQTGQDQLSLGVFADAQTYIVATLSILDSCLNYPVLSIIKQDKGKETRFDVSISEEAPISSHYCGSGDDKEVVNALLKEISDKGVPLTFSKRGRRLSAKITVTNPKDGGPVTIETGPLTSLRLPGKAALLLGQSGDAKGESLAYIQDVRIVAAP